MGWQRPSALLKYIGNFLVYEDGSVFRIIDSNGTPLEVKDTAVEIFTALLALLTEKCSVVLLGTFPLDSNVTINKGFLIRFKGGEDTRITLAAKPCLTLQSETIWDDIEFYSTLDGYDHVSIQADVTFNNPIFNLQLDIQSSLLGVMRNSAASPNEVIFRNPTIVQGGKDTANYFGILVISTDMKKLSIKDMTAKSLICNGTTGRFALFVVQSGVTIDFVEEINTLIESVNTKYTGSAFLNNYGVILKYESVKHTQLPGNNTWTNSSSYYTPLESHAPGILEEVTIDKMTLNERFHPILIARRVLISNFRGIGDGNTAELDLGTMDGPTDGAVADDGGITTDETTAANNDTENDMTLLPSTPAVDDAYYFGADETFKRLDVRISTQGVGVWTIVWEYWDGDSWDALADVVDDTTGFTAAAGSYYKVKFTHPVDWDKTTVGGIADKYWVRARVSAYTSVTTAPKGRRSFLCSIRARADIVNYSHKNAGLTMNTGWRFLTISGYCSEGSRLLIYEEGHSEGEEKYVIASDMQCSYNKSDGEKYTNPIQIGYANGVNLPLLKISGLTMRGCGYAIAGGTPQYPTLHVFRNIDLGPRIDSQNPRMYQMTAGRDNDNQRIWLSDSYIETYLPPLKDWNPIRPGDRFRNVTWKNTTTAAVTVSENTILSGTFAIDSTGFKSVTVSHELPEAPDPEHVQAVIVEDTDVDDWWGYVVKVKDITTTQLTVDVYVADASATGGATAKLAVKVSLT